MSDVEVRAIKPIDANRAVAHVAIGEIEIKSIWILDRQTKPKISWPQTAKGYPIVDAAPELKAKINDMILAEISETGPLL